MKARATEPEARCRSACTQFRTLSTALSVLQCPRPSLKRLGSTPIPLAPTRILHPRILHHSPINLPSISHPLEFCISDLLQQPLQEWQYAEFRAEHLEAVVDTIIRPTRRRFDEDEAAVAPSR